jgi:RNA polymerase sigma factor (sigma-70 family)
VNDTTDQQLLREYAAHDSQAAFSELVRRHLDLVHSAAVRMVVDRHLAEDVSQAVFVALARQADSLQDRAVLTGWLHRVTQNLAAKAVRTEVRRRTREHEAATMHSPALEAVWEQIAPHLDDALGWLDEADRDALFLRYFERKSAREIGERLSLGEEAAQKRVTRALERLRGIFVERGLALPTASLGGAILLSAVQAAPAGLATTVLTGVAATAGVSAGAGASLLLFELMSATSIKITAAALVTAALSTAFVLQHQQNQRLLAELDHLRAEAAKPVPAPASDKPAPAGPSDELLRLRGEAARLRTLETEMAGLKKENAQLRTAASPASRPKPKTGAEFLAENATKPGVQQTASGLQYKVLTPGFGRTPTSNDTVKVHYHGTLIDGTVFDSSVDRGEPINLPVGAVIPGWTEALQLMKEGAKWQLAIPSKLAYGEKGAGDKIAPESTLVFEVELLGIEPAEGK